MTTPNDIAALEEAIKFTGAATGIMTEVQIAKCIISAARSHLHLLKDIEAGTVRIALCEPTEEMQTGAMDRMPSKEGLFYNDIYTAMLAATPEYKFGE